MTFQRTSSDLWGIAVLVFILMMGLLFLLYPLKNTLGLVPLLSQLIPSTLRDQSPVIFLQHNQEFVFYLLGVSGLVLVVSVFWGRK